jgi:hypothetical protein
LSVCNRREPERQKQKRKNWFTHINPLNLR